MGSGQLTYDQQYMPYRSITCISDGWCTVPIVRCMLDDLPLIPPEVECDLDPAVPLCTVIWRLEVLTGLVVARQ